jgi:hypothetical protein
MRDFKALANHPIRLILGAVGTVILVGFGSQASASLSPASVSPVASVTPRASEDSTAPKQASRFVTPDPNEDVLDEYLASHRQRVANADKLQAFLKWILARPGLVAAGYTNQAAVDEDKLTLTLY